MVVTPRRAEHGRQGLLHVSALARDHAVEIVAQGLQVTGLLWVIGIRRLGRRGQLVQAASEVFANAASPRSAAA
jgi:hypothetical protein